MSTQFFDNTPALRLPGVNPLTRLARRQLQRTLDKLAVDNIRLRDYLTNDSTAARSGEIIVDVHDPRFYSDILYAGSNGAASAYRDGFWSCNDLTMLFRAMIKNLAELDGMETGLASLGNWWLRKRHRARSNTREGSRGNIHAHYDLGNELFELMLDSTMTYSSGYFVTPSTTLEEASIEKLDRICRKLALQASDSVVEIGTGWGSFAIHAAATYGCHVTTVTISEEQYSLAKERVHQAGLDDLIDIRLCDYRDLEGKFDKLVSIEMIEAVGHEFLPGYFSTCMRLLKDTGQACIQAITMPDQRYEQYLKNTDFIQQFVFPGSCVPSLTAIQNAITANTDFRISHLEDFGLHYAKTLNEWRRSFTGHEDRIRALGYGDDFLRLWHYYLCYCEAGFLERYTSVVQLVLDKPGCRNTPVDV